MKEKKDFIKSKFYFFYLIGFCLILALPLLNLPPTFSPPDWGKTIVFRIVLSILIFLFIWQVLIKRENFSFNFGQAKIGVYLLLALLGIFFLATVFSLDRNFSFWGNPYRSGGFLNFAFYIIFAILAFLILRKSDWQKIWDFAIFIGILVSLVAIFQWKGLFSQILVPFSERPPSTVGNPIFLAIYLLLLTFSTLSFLIKERNRVKKFFYLISLFLFVFVAVFITLTRAAIIGLAIGFLWFFFAYPKKLILLKTFLGIILILGVYGIYYLNTAPQFPQFIQENRILRDVASRVSIKAGLSDPRISGWKVAKQAIMERPILGYGPENFAIGFDKYYDPALPKIQQDPYMHSSWWDRAHNFVFDIGVTAGIPALIIYLSLFWILFWKLQRLKNQHQSTQISINQCLIAHGVQATFLAYLTANFFSFDVFSTYLILFLLISYSLHLIAESNPEGESLVPYGAGPENTPKSKSNQPGFNGKTLAKKISSIIIKWRKPILIFLLVILVWFIWNFNIKPFQINSQINRADILVENGRCDLALKKMEEILPKRTFLDAYLRLEYVDILIKCKEKMPENSLELVKKGINLMEEAIKIQPYHTSNYIVLGSLIDFLMDNEKNIEIKKNLKTEADSYFEKAYKLSPKRQEVFIEWIKSDLIAGEYQKAKEKAQRCIELNENLSDCWWLMGINYIYLGEKEKAKENIKIAEKKGFSVNSENSLLKLAKVYVDIGDYKELLGIYQKLVNLKPDNPAYHISLAIVYKELADFENAKKEIKKALELAPEIKEEAEDFLKKLK